MSGLGVTNCEGLIYLGFMRFSFNPSATGLYLDVGLLNNDNSFFFGKFLDSDFEYPSYEFEYGEKIDFKEDLIESQRKNKKNEDYLPEYFSKNKYFSFNKNKITLTPNIIPSASATQVDIVMENNNSVIKSIELFSQDNTNEEIIITNRIDKQVNELYLYDSKIFIEKYNITLFFLDDSFVLCENFLKEKNFEGYVIEPDDIDLCLFKFYDIKMIISQVDELLNQIEQIMNLKLINCKVFYQEFEPVNNYQRNKKKDYYEIDSKNNIIKILNGKDNKRKKTDIYKNLNILFVKDLLPNYYLAFNKFEKKRCCCG
jgi:hypothetical protein